MLVQVGLAVGSALSETFAEVAGLAGIGVQLLFLKYSRDDERQADTLGVEYSRKGVYNPGEMISFFSSLEKQGDLSGGHALPGFLSTHPLTAERIRLPLVIPAVLEKEELDADPGQAGDLGKGFAQGAAHGQTDLDEHHLAQPADAVPGVDMPQLMAQDDGQLGLRAHQSQDAAGDIDVSARNGEGVDNGRIQDGELIGELGPVCVWDKSLADGLDIDAELAVGIGAILPADLDVGLLAKGDFLFF